MRDYAIIPLINTAAKILIHHDVYAQMCTITLTVCLYTSILYYEYYIYQQYSYSGLRLLPEVPPAPAPVPLAAAEAVAEPVFPAPFWICNGSIIEIAL